MQLPACAMDVEFFRRKTYFPIICLVQVAVPDGTVYLFDTLTWDHFDGLRELLVHPGTTKVFHGFTQDLEALEQLCHVTPVNCFDTQLAAAFAGLGFQLGFAELVSTILNEDIPKQQQTSLWHKRPLSEEQLAYARLDVSCLYRCYHVLQERYLDSDRQRWLAEETEWILADFTRNYHRRRTEPRRFPGIYELTPRQYTLLSYLLKWRDQQARQRNLPVQWVIGNKRLLEIAKLMSPDPQRIRQAGELTRRQWLAYRQSLLDTIEKVYQLPENRLLHPPRKKQPSRAQQRKINAVKKICEAKAKELGIAPEIMASSKEIKELILNRKHKNSILQNGWRWTILKDELEKFELRNKL